MSKPESTDAYIKEFPPEVQEKLNEIRSIIKAAVPPEATEKISWDMPTFYLYGNLVHFAANKSHTGFYPGANGVEHFTGRFDAEGYKYSKGAVQFPFSRPLPRDLITEIVKFRVGENLAENEAKKSKK